MSKKKRKQNVNTGAAQSEVQAAAKTELTVQEDAKTEPTVQELIHIPEIQEIQEKRETSEPTGGSETAPAGGATAGKVMKGLFFGSIIAAILLLAFCLYKTAGKLQTVQAMSDALQTDLNHTQAKLEELLYEKEAALEKMQEETTGEDGTPEDGEAEPQGEKKPRVTPEPERYTVCIDAGHGAHDTGAVLEAEDGTVRYEKDDNLWLAQLVKKELEAYGIKVLMTREDDSFLELYDRTLYANSMDVDALISFHRNAYYLNGEMNDRVGGVEIWIHNSRPTEARQLANRMLDAILEVGGMADRGVRYGSMTDVEENYAINRRAAMTSMIVEMGFISNPEDNKAYDTNGEAYAKAIAKEIYEWLVQ